VYESALAGVEMAERDLERTTVKAPYDGRIREKFADVGQMVSARQSQLARIYSTDTAEIRLPISLKDIEYLDLPESYSNRSTNDTKPRVIVSGSYGGAQYEWEGVIDRTEGAIDPKTRLSYVVAKIEEPYKKEENSDRPPLKVGLFVEASIQGKRIENAFKIPRKALRENNTVYTVDQENRIVFKDVEVYQTDTEWAIITSGLEDGDRICITPLEYAVMGMQVERESRESIEIQNTENN
jgi:RND family efflux transporter MFP subunit